MRRKMDLARLILLKLEECPFTGQPHEIHIDGYTDQDISYHIKLLHEAGFVTAIDSNLIGAPYTEWEPISITWDGQEFLESSREKTRWEKAKSLVADKGGPMTLEALRLVLSDLIKKSLSLS